jgi:DNA polymerase-3 subunit delta
MAHTAQIILEELKKGIYRPLYFLQGTEPFYIDQIVHYIEDNALSESERGFNQILIYGKDSNMGNIMNQARRFPMMAQRQVVIVKEAQELADLNREDGQTLLSKYAQNPLASTVLVFAYKYKKLDGRKELPKILDKKATLVNSEKIPDYKLNDWILAYLKTQNYSANSSAVQMLADHLGNDLSRIANELEKLKISLPVGSEITREVIHEKIGISKEFNAFEFQNALATRNLSKSLQIAQYFVANPKAPHIILVATNLFSFFVKVLQAHIHKDLGDEGLAKVLGLNSTFFLKDYKAARSRFSEVQVQHIIHQIRLADGYSKGIEAGGKEPLDIYKDLILNIVKC